MGPCMLSGGSALLSCRGRGADGVAYRPLRVEYRDGAEVVGGSLREVDSDSAT
jgi:hypothetical protein